MRLLNRGSNNEISLTANLLTGVPRYAILSHTWGSDDEEVNFHDMIVGAGRNKTGYHKIEFCARQAANDGLQHFWIDTCCINKASDLELAEAINSMFRWYRDATKCYAYLADVPTCERNGDEITAGTEELLFRSRWWSRSWTLQELIAPFTVDFFSQDGSRIGDKRYLEQQIREITKIPVAALQGHSPSEFSIAERLSWAKDRQCKREEDKAYSLLGILDVHMPLIYGEGLDYAWRRLMREVDDVSNNSLEQNVHLAKLPIAHGAAFDSYDNQHDPRCHPATRVDLLASIRHWANDEGGSCIYWLSGMAGTGKSTIARTLAQEFADESMLGATFFFKRGGGDRGRTNRFITTIASQMLRNVPQIAGGVLSAIATTPDISEKQIEYQFEKLLLQPLKTAKLQQYTTSIPVTVVVIDALDECESEEDVNLILLNLARMQEFEQLRVRILVTSRPELPIRLGFKRMLKEAHLDVHLHEIAKEVIDGDILTFLTDELTQIRDDFSLPDNWPGHETCVQLANLASPLFIHAATICRFIGDPKWDPPDQLQILMRSSTRSQASKLDRTYIPVLDRLVSGCSDAVKSQLVDEFQLLIGSMIILEEPLATGTFADLFDIPRRKIDRRLDTLRSVIVVPSDLHLPARLLHSSFRDFLLDKEKKEKYEFWVDENLAHSRLAKCCLDLLRRPGVLKQNLCNVRSPGTLRNEIDPLDIQRHLSSAVQYACRYWATHLIRSHNHEHLDVAYLFFKSSFLYWLEALSLIGRANEIRTVIDMLVTACSGQASDTLLTFLCHAKSFVHSNSAVIDTTPLQIYASGLCFGSKRNIIRRVFSGEIPSWITGVSRISGIASTSSQKADGHGDWVSAVAYSPNGNRLASASADGTVRLWDSKSGKALQRFEAYGGWVRDIAFSPKDHAMLACASADGVVRVWSTESGEVLQTFASTGSWARAVAFSPHATRIASASADGVVRLWDVNPDNVLDVNIKTLKGHTGWLNAIAFSPDGSILASASGDRTVRLWNGTDGAILRVLEGHTGWVRAVAFTADGQRLVSGSGDGTLIIWDVASVTMLHQLIGHGGSIRTLACSSNGEWIASGSADRTVRLWDTFSGAEMHVLRGHSDLVRGVDFSPDSKRLASASSDRTIRFWDPVSGASLGVIDSHDDYMHAIVFSRDASRLASATAKGAIKLWLAETEGESEIRALEGHGCSATAIVFSQNGNWLASGSTDGTVRLWDTASKSNVPQRIYATHNDSVNALEFSPDDRRLAVASDDGTVGLWDMDANSSTATHTTKTRSGSIRAVTFSSDSQRLAFTSGPKIELCDIQSDVISGLQTLEGHSDDVRAVAFSPDGKQLASSSDDGAVRLWDTERGESIRVLPYGVTIDQMSFSPDGSYLTTSRGVIRLSNHGDAECSSEQESLDIFVSDQWVKQGKQRLLWLPAEYRATCAIVKGQKVVLGHYSGEVSTFQFDLEQLNKQR